MLKAIRALKPGVYLTAYPSANPKARVVLKMSHAVAV